jgi:spoIIIJ-associated protein
LAEQAVQQVRETQTEFVIKQLSSADRRYIHQLLEEFPDIETHSQGREPNRHLIVKLVNS